MAAAVGVGALTTPFLLLLRKRPMLRGEVALEVPCVYGYVM